MGEPAATVGTERREEILVAASELFGHQGYRDTSWTEIAERVHLTETAVFHYFESKQQCLLEVMGEGVRTGHRAFDLCTGGVDFDVGFERTFRHGFEKTHLEACRNRIVMAEQGRLHRAARRKPREEEARQRANEEMLELDRAGVAYFREAMSDGWIPKSDPGLLWRAIFGLYKSVWHWYRPDGAISQEAIADHFVPRFKAIAGIEPIGSEPL